MQAKKHEKFTRLYSGPPVSYFDSTTTSTIQADESQHGLGACLLQRGKPIAYASRSLSPAESNYKKYKKYLYVFQTKAKRNQNPLESIVNKPLYKVSPRLQHVLLKLQNYDLTIKYIKDLHVADTLSRAYLTNPDDHTHNKDLEFAIHTMIKNLPVSDEKKSQLQAATTHDH